MYKVTGPRGGRYECDTLAEAKKLTKRGGTYRKVTEAQAEQEWLDRREAHKREEYKDWERPTRHPHDPYGRRRNPVKSLPANFWHKQHANLYKGKSTVPSGDGGLYWLRIEKPFGRGDWELVLTEGGWGDTRSFTAGTFKTVAEAKKAASEDYGDTDEPLSLFEGIIWDEKRNPAHDFDSNQQTLYDTLMLVAENKADYYPHDPAGAVRYAWRDYKRRRNESEGEDFRVIKNALVTDLHYKWSGQAHKDEQAGFDEAWEQDMRERGLRNPAGDTTQTLHWNFDPQDAGVHFAYAYLEGEPAAIFHATYSNGRWTLEGENILSGAPAWESRGTLADSKIAAQGVWDRWKKKRNPQSTPGRNRWQDQSRDEHKHYVYTNGPVAFVNVTNWREHPPGKPWRVHYYKPPNDQDVILGFFSSLAKAKKEGVKAWKAGVKAWKDSYIKERNP